MKTKTKSKRDKRIGNGGKRAGSGRPKRETAVRKNVLVETNSIKIFAAFGDGSFQAGIDKAAPIIERIMKGGK